LPETLHRRFRFRAPWIIFWVGFGLRVATILIGHTYRIRVPDHHFGFGWEMGRIAQSLVLGQGYANPFNGPSGPTAWTPPLYPLLIALSFKLFGIYTNAAALFLMVCDSVFSAAIAAAVFEIAARCFDAHGIARRSGKFFGRETATPVALWAAWLWAVYPAALQYAVHWIWEMSLSAMLFAWIFVLALRLRGVGEGDRTRDEKIVMDGATRVGGWLWFGALWGLLALSNASLLLCFPAMMLWIAWPKVRDKASWARLLGGAAVAVAAFALVMTPWVARNEHTLHAPIVTRSNFGVELYASSLESHDAFPWGTAMPLWVGAPEFQRYVRMGEIQYSKVRGEEAMARLRVRKLQFAKWTLDRFLFFWDGTPHTLENHRAQEYLRETSYAFLSLCGLLGLGLMLRRRVPGAGLFLLAFVLVPLPYYLITVQARFRHPIEPLICVLGVYLFRSAEQKRIDHRG
jgi:hypothetical protein